MHETPLNSVPLSEQELNAVKTLYRAFTEKNLDLLDEICSPDWQDIPLALGQGPGLEGAKKIMPFFFQAFPDLHVEVLEIIGSSGRAGVRARMTATHSGEIFGVPGTGRRVEVALHEFHHLSNGRVTHTWHLEDWFGMLNQVGAWPPPQSGTPAGNSKSQMG